MSTPAGLLVPVSPRSGPVPEHPATRYLHTYITYEELFGKPIAEHEVVDLLAELSAYDVLNTIAHLSCMVSTAPFMDRARQSRIMEALRWPAEARDAIEKVLDASKGPRVLFFPQQLIHLARLAVLHADDRPPDDYRGGAQVGEFVRCLIGVTELLGEEDLDPDNLEQSIGFMLRQTSINGRSDSVSLWARHFDLFARIWNKVKTPEAFDAAEAFERYTGMSLQDWLIIGFGIYTPFMNFGGGKTETCQVVPASHFAQSQIPRNLIELFLEQNAVTLDQAREMIQQEEAEHGSTVYLCQTFEQRPLLWLPTEREAVIPFAVDAFERRVTEGIFWVLSDGALAEGMPREHFTGAFGQVFEESVHRTFERALPSIGVPRVHRARAYKRGKNTVDSTDVVIGYGTSAAFVEVVAKRPQVATVTRGDYAAFESDLDKGVLKKAKQLDRCIADFRAGTLTFDGMTADEIKTIYPVIVMAGGLPLMPPIPTVIENKIVEENLLTDLPPVAIMSAADLAALGGSARERFQL